MALQQLSDLLMQACAKRLVQVVAVLVTSKLEVSADVEAGWRRRWLPLAVLAKHGCS